MIPELYPPAVALLRGDAPGTWRNNGPYKICWHTTETLTLPAYDNDDDNLDAELAPHLTYDPQTRKWYQDYKLTRPSEALRAHDDDMVIQIEIICYSDKRTVDRYGGGRLWVGNLPDTAYQDLAAFVVWLKQYEDIPSVWPEPGRMTPAEFHAYSGHVGHVHVPDNTHWDPGVFDPAKLFGYIDQEGDNTVGFTQHEVDTLKKLVESLDEVNSGGAFAREAVKLVREERQKPLHTHEGVADHDHVVEVRLK